LAGSEPGVQFSRELRETSWPAISRCRSGSGSGRRSGRAAA